MQNLPQKFSKFVMQFTSLVDRSEGYEAQILEKGRDMLADLVTQDDWLPSEYARPHSQYYQQYLLYADPSNRFSIVSFVWGPGQKTPIHDHTVWALIGILRGAEQSETFTPSADGQPMIGGEVKVLHPGAVETLSLSTGDIHRVSNFYDDRVSISIHIYGGNIGRILRHTFDAQTSERKNFMSGYANENKPMTV